MPKDIPRIEAVEGGLLVGLTDTDYFYFQCPTCGNSQILQTPRLQRARRRTSRVRAGVSEEARRDFTIGFELYCRNCGFHDFVKVSNTGWQGGKLKNSPASPR